MRHAIAFLCFALLTAFTHAAEGAKPNTLTPQEAADGWLLLFDGETSFGWKVDGEAKVADGRLVLGGEKATTATLTTEFGKSDMVCEYAIRGDKADLVFDHQGEAPRVSAPLRNQVSSALKIKFDVPTFTNTVLGIQPGQIGPVQETTVTAKFAPTLHVYVPAGSQLSLWNFKVKPLGLQSIFNGKDLTGWKEFPGRKSKFTVNDKGELNIKDGPGDLQTEGQYGDFIVQLDCISNGKHLNSGVFFRCRPNEYQQGYEAQIRNEFTPDTERDYAIEEYDPKTNELKDKKKIKSTAVDYGTGAIYRRVPARKGVSKDNEWFTMTVVAQGRHMAAWVNGVQVTDWMDYRPLKDNARNGCRLEKGPISLQGHDPTTDLSFRNFKIAEIPSGGK